MKNLDFITIGSTTRDIMYHTKDGVVIPKFEKCNNRDSLAFTLGSKFEVNKAYFNYGGGANNTAVSLTRLGFKVGTIMAIGEDDFGANLIKYLKKEKVFTDLVQVVKNQMTGMSVIINSEQDGRYILFICRAANKNLKFSISKLKDLKIKWLYLNSLNIPGWEKVIQEVIKYKQKYPEVKIYWNPGSWQIKAKNKIKSCLKLIEVLQLNKDEAVCLVEGKDTGGESYDVEKLLKILYEYGPKLVVITDGNNGVFCYDGKKIYNQKALVKKPKDTTGAGDSFGTGFVAGLNLFKGDIVQALKSGVCNAASVVMKRGAHNGLLSRKALLRNVKVIH